MWHDDLTYYFINKWQTEPCLYHVNHEDYHVKDKRTLALERIIESMSYREFFPLLTVQNLTDKMNSLRTYFNTQKNKHQASKSSGSGTNKIFKIRWQFYDCLSFLLDGTTPKETYSTLTLDTADENNPPPPPKKANKRKRQASPTTHSSSLIEEATSVLKDIPDNRRNPLPSIPKSHDMHFGETIGRMWSEIIDGQEKDMLKLEMQRMLLSVKYMPKLRQSSISEPILQLHNVSPNVNRSTGYRCNSYLGQ